MRSTDKRPRKRKRSLLSLIESIRDFRVLFIGDSIIDEYHYVTPLGKSAKEHLIPMRYESEEVFGGGVHAAAAHVRDFCDVEVSTRGPSTRKVRFVDKNYLRKLAEVHYPDGNEGDEIPDFASYDVVVVCDFGHGAITSDVMERLSEARFLAVSAQTNSSNIGFNLITKYPKADYIVIDEPEARLAAADRVSPIGDVIEKLANGRCRKFVVTHGRHGAYGYQDGVLYHRPANTDLVRDTMGARDAFFAVTAPMAKHGHVSDLLTIGNAAGGLKTQTVGHRQAITKASLLKALDAR